MAMRTRSSRKGVVALGGMLALCACYAWFFRPGAGVYILSRHSSSPECRPVPLRPAAMAPSAPQGVAQPACPPGHFGSKCQHNKRSIFHEHDPYAELGDVRAIPADVSGWGPGYEFYERLVASVRPQLTIEIGVWKGSSALHLTRAMAQHVGGGALVAVDTWLGAPEFWTRERSYGKPDPTRNLMLKNGFPQVYYQFLSNVLKANASAYVIPFPAPSGMASAVLSRLGGVQADLIHIDAAHEYEDVLQDLAHWWPLLKPGGVLLGDDWSISWPSVVRGACDFAAQKGLYIDASWQDRKWWIRKPRRGKDCAPFPPEWAVSNPNCSTVRP